MSERAQQLEAALRELTAMVRGECPSLLNEDSGGCARLSLDIDTLLAVAAPPVGVSPQQVQRFDLVSVNFAYTSDHEMERADDGEWVRFDDVFPLTSLSPVEPKPPVHNDLCSWCLTQADHVAVSPQPDEYRERMRLHDLVLEVIAAWQESDNYQDDGQRRGMNAKQRSALRARLKLPASLSPVEPTPSCAICGKPATCHGSYDGAPDGFACDDCCGHGCEDGKCQPVEPTPSREPLTGAELLDRFRPVEPTPPIDKHATGLHRKFIVTRTDGKSAPGQKHDGCDYFVLDLTHDPHAAPALRAYADSCRADYPLLAADLDAKVPAVEPAPPTPAPCVWRVTGGALGNWVAPSCIAESIPAPWGTERATACHLCGKPMEISQ